MNNSPFVPADILLPAAGVSLEKWSVVACDQYTSQPDYWRRVEETVGSAPSALRLIIPEIYLDDTTARISQVCTAMEDYLARGVFAPPVHGFILTERTLADGSLRQGLVGAVDLEQYDFSAGSESPVRATEGTVLERIPPRVAVREGAVLELPHIMLLIDDPGRTVIEPLAEAGGRRLYDFPLMEGGGRIRGTLISPEDGTAAMRAISALGKASRVAGKNPLTIAIGDGNHSLAAAKTCWEQIKPELSPEAAAMHPARFALCELCNLHSPSLQFEAIHRVVFDTDPDSLMEYLSRFCVEGEDGQSFLAVSSNGQRAMRVVSPASSLTVGSLQALLDAYISEYGGRIDYIHGGQAARELGLGQNAMSFLLPAMRKEELFPTVITDGALPRKTFSMGHAADKRYYLEARKITQ